jgi:hypothetical protein
VIRLDKKTFFSSGKSSIETVPILTSGTSNFTNSGVSSNRLKPMTVVAAPSIVYMTTTAAKPINKYPSMLFITKKLALFRLIVYKLPSTSQ